MVFYTKIIAYMIQCTISQKYASKWQNVSSFSNTRHLKNSLGSVSGFIYWIWKGGNKTQKEILYYSINFLWRFLRKNNIMV